MNFEFEFSYVATLNPPVDIGPGPFGNRNVFEVTGGTLEGKRLKGKVLSTDYGDQYFRTTPRFETGDPRYAWLNQSVFVAEGRIGPGKVEYKVYRVV
ncbi:DUF3237 domain-containing protein [Rhodoblastus sp.]|uniref:DUF3237 domain-containing protein n=1 Tax=Rhodoblastus sp. TaxID=1962975 RepID=UPI003F986563